MAKPLFDPDVYELQLANILLDTLLKNEVIGMHTYKATKRTLNEMEEYDNEHSNTICTINSYFL